MGYLTKHVEIGSQVTIISPFTVFPKTWEKSLYLYCVASSLVISFVIALTTGNIRLDTFNIIGGVRWESKQYESLGKVLTSLT